MMPRSPSRNGRVLAAITLLAVCSLGAGAVVFTETENEQQAVASARIQFERVQEVAHRVDEGVDRQEAALDDYMLTGTYETLANYGDAVTLETDALRLLDGNTFGQTEIESALVTLGAVSNDWQSVVALPAIKAKQSLSQDGINRFLDVAIGDYRGVETASAHVESLLDQGRAALAQRAANVDAARIYASAIAGVVLLLAFGLAILVVRQFGRALERDARQASVLNRFTEITTFAAEDSQVAAANLTALGRLVRPDASVTHILNRSLDRAVPEATTGNAIADVLPLHELGLCAGMLRGTMYVSDDLADDLSVHCPIYPAQAGTLACVPLKSGEPVGAIHLYWAKPNALPLEQRAAVARISEHTALAMGNRRLLAALHGQANTDARTGLANSRAFDLALEERLVARSKEPVSVLMLDVDHFKKFNDRHGHPAGDEALRSFANVLRSCMREGDIAARYGGEEFAVMLPGADGEAARMVAERIRDRTESTIISLSPGLTDRITVSVGIATAPDNGVERVALLRLADEALYLAKSQGRNLVASVGQEATPDASPGSIASPVSLGSRIAGRRRA